MDVSKALFLWLTMDLKGFVLLPLLGEGTPWSHEFRWAHTPVCILPTSWACWDCSSPSGQWIEMTCSSCDPYLSWHVVSHSSDGMQVFYHLITEDQVGWGSLNGHRVGVIFTKVIYVYHGLGCSKSLSLIVTMDHSSYFLDQVIIIQLRWEKMSFSHVETCTSEIRLMV